MGHKGLLHRLVGLLLGAASAGAWLTFVAANGFARGNDTRGYLRLADALWSLRVLTSARTPGYPIFLVACRALAAALGTDLGWVVAVLQTILLAGVTTVLVHDLGWRLTTRPGIGALAAALFALDVDLQQYGATMLTEALMVTLTVAMVSLRLRDGTWRRAAWLLAALALVRPNFVVFPLAFAGLDALRLRRLRAVLAPLWPTAVVLAVWSAVALASGADPARPLRWFVPMHTFGTVYEAGLWMRLPDGPERRLLADQKARGHNAYQAAEALEAFAGPGSKATVAQAAIRADPLGYAAARAALLPLEFRRGSWAEAELFQYVHPDAALLHVLSRFHSRYRGLFYGSFPLFLVLLGMFAANGFGWPVARAAGREVIVPFVAVLFVSVGLSSLGTYGVGRLAIAFHPFDALCWACASGALAHRLVTGRGAEAPPSHAPSSHTRPTTSLKV